MFFILKYNLYVFCQVNIFLFLSFKYKQYSGKQHDDGFLGERNVLNACVSESHKLTEVIL